MDQTGQITLGAGQVDALSARLSSGQSDVDQLAKDFEALFVSMMLKTMRESMSQDMFAGDASDTYGGLFDSFMGQHIAENGGFGLSALLQPATAMQTTADKQTLSPYPTAHLKAY